VFSIKNNPLFVASFIQQEGTTVFLLAPGLSYSDKENTPKDIGP
jgi:hypothetical protein